MWNVVVVAVQRAVTWVAEKAVQRAAQKAALEQLEKQAARKLLEEQVRATAREVAQQTAKESGKQTAKGVSRETVIGSVFGAGGTAAYQKQESEKSSVQQQPKREAEREKVQSESKPIYSREEQEKVRQETIQKLEGIHERLKATEQARQSSRQAVPGDRLEHTPDSTRFAADNLRSQNSNKALQSAKEKQHELMHTTANVMMSSRQIGELKTTPADAGVAPKTDPPPRQEQTHGASHSRPDAQTTRIRGVIDSGRRIHEKHEDKNLDIKSLSIEQMYDWLVFYQSGHESKKESEKFSKESIEILTSAKQEIDRAKIIIENIDHGWLKAFDTTRGVNVETGKEVLSQVRNVIRDRSAAYANQSFKEQQEYADAVVSKAVEEYLHDPQRQKPERSLFTVRQQDITPTPPPSRPFPDLDRGRD